MQLIVIGMHRSGTSAVTRLLNMAGAYFGPEGSATRANEENPKGFWERRDVRDVCDGLLQGAGFDWWRLGRFDLDAIPDPVRDEQLAAFREIVLEMDAHRPWVLKEPRFCVLFPLLRPMLEVPVCIHVTREPLEVAASLAARNEFPLSVCTALWEVSTLRAVQATDGLPRYHVAYETLLQDPVGTFEALLDWLDTTGVQGLRRPSQREIAAFMDPALHRHRRPAADRAGVLNVQQMELAASIDAGAYVSADWNEAEPSDGATAALLEHESRVDEVARTAAELVRAREATVELRREADERIATIEKEASERLEERVARIQEAVDDGVDEVERQLRSIDRSRAWRTAQQAMYVRQRVNPGVARPEPRRIDKAIRELDRVRRAPTTVPKQPAGLTSPSAGLSGGGATRIEQLRNGVELRRAGPAPSRETGRAKVAVIAWDVGHNPLGRAYTMAEILARRFDVEVWGAQFDRYGHRLWAPLRNPGLPISYFGGRNLPEHMDAMEAVAERIDADAIWVSKPRFPSLALGVLAKQLRDRPLVLDVDDHELAFFAGAERGLSMAELSRTARDDLLIPFERAWTRACEPMIGRTDDVTVSNLALQERYGGTLVPHARDERRFDPELYDRESIRAELGLGPDDRLLLFGGTVRAHKGVVELLEALDALGDARYHLAVFATPELEQLRDQVGDLGRWLLRLPSQPFERLPSVLAAADLSCVLQDRTHLVSRYQMPAKVIDALAMGLPCLVTPTRPLEPLIADGVLHTYDGSTPLHERIAEVADETRDAERARALFLEEYSCAAVAERVVPVFQQLLEDPPPLADALQELVGAPARLLGPRRGATADASSAPSVPARLPGSRRWRAAPEEQYDLVVFWRQNDTSIYGRRQDMLVEYLRRSGRFGTIVHFDNPISPGSLARSYFASTGRADQRHLVVQQTLKRLLHQRDRDGIVRRTFLYGNKRSVRAVLPQRNEYEGYVSSVLAKHGVGKRLTIFLVYPTNEYFPSLADALAPDLVVTDVVDDNRTWYRPGSHHHARVERNYRDILARSDVVLANCAPVAEEMESFASDVQVVPNGCELPDGSGRGAPPPELRLLSGPVIGYVGNMSDRIDIDLLDDLARARPEWNFVFVGSAHLDQSVLRLDRHANVRFVGVKPYEEAKRFIAHFDVALIPHLDNEMTRSMNPLKAFVYCAQGVPVVSTPVANMDELGDLIVVAKGVDGFVDAIEDALETGPRGPDLDLLEPHSWDRRVEQIITLIDEAAGAGEPR